MIEKGELPCVSWWMNASVCSAVIAEAWPLVPLATIGRSCVHSGCWSLRDAGSPRETAAAVWCQWIHTFQSFVARTWGSDLCSDRPSWAKSALTQNAPYIIPIDRSHVAPQKMFVMLKIQPFQVRSSPASLGAYKQLSGGGGDHSQAYLVLLRPTDNMPPPAVSAGFCTKFDDHEGDTRDIQVEARNRKKKILSRFFGPMIRGISRFSNFNAEKASIFIHEFRAEA